MARLLGGIIDFACRPLALLFVALSPVLSATDKPNLLFIAIDDQNDWISHLGEHPMVKTPHLDKRSWQHALASLAKICVRS